jgi:hypothetical protein
MTDRSIDWLIAFLLNDCCLVRICVLFTIRCTCAHSFLPSAFVIAIAPIVLRMQPSEAVYMKTNVKSPGFTAKPIQSELEVNYDTRFFAHQKEANPDAYTRLILDVLQGRHGAFVRDDELRRAWQIFTPLLDQIENENIQPIVYKQGSRGPAEADKFIFEQAGYVRNEDYIFYETNVARKTEGSNAPPVSDKLACVKVPEEELCDVGLFGLAVMVSFEVCRWGDFCTGLFHVHYA